MSESGPGRHLNQPVMSAPSTAIHLYTLLNSLLEHGAKKSVAVHRKQQHVCGHQCAPGYVRQGASFPCWSCWAVRKSGRRRRRGRASSVPTLSRSPTGFSSGDDGCHQSTLHFYILRCTSWCMIRIWLLSNQWFRGYWLPCHFYWLVFFFAWHSGWNFGA